MKKLPSSKAPSCSIDKFIGTDFDDVQLVADNMDDLKQLAGDLDDIDTVVDNLQAIKDAPLSAAEAKHWATVAESAADRFDERYAGLGPVFPTTNLADGTLFYYVGSQLEKGLYVHTYLQDGSSDWALISEEGPQGPQGPVGPVGPLGPVGPTGSQGPVGPQGSVGPRPNHEWLNSKLRFQQGDGTWGNYSDLIGPQGPQGVRGPQGVVGPIPSHEWSGSKLRFQQGDGSMGPYSDLKGPIGPQGIQGIQGPEGPQGNDGSSFKIDAFGLLADRVNHDTAVKGFTYYATDYEVSANISPKFTRFVGDGVKKDFVLSFTPDGPQSLAVTVGGVLQGADKYTVTVLNEVYTVSFAAAVVSGAVVTAREFSISTGYGAIYIKNSATSGDWSDAIPFGKGPRGDQGPRGPTGVQGPIGLQGDRGPQGPAGEQGPRGIQGPEGNQGPQGERGPVGAQGVQGDKGIDGAQGPMGATGPRGPQGEQGPQGITGIQGPRGDRGEMGLPGPQGVVGPAGPQGPIGPIGPVGPVGPQGAKGPDGAAGKNGTDGADGMSSSAAFLSVPYDSNTQSTSKVLINGNGDYTWMRFNVTVPRPYTRKLLLDEIVVLSPAPSGISFNYQLQYKVTIAGATTLYELGGTVAGQKLIPRLRPYINIPLNQIATVEVMLRVFNFVGSGGYLIQPYWSNLADKDKDSFKVDILPLSNEITQ